MKVDFSIPFTTVSTPKSAQIDDLVNRICALEVNTNPKRSPEMLGEIRRVAEITTHMSVSNISVTSLPAHVDLSVPYYHVVSKELAMGKLSPVVNWTRAFLIEGIYRRLGTRAF